MTFKELKLSVKKDNKLSYLFMMPYIILFFTFIIIPVVAAIYLSFTYFNTIGAPKFLGLKNYIDLLTNDEIFMQNVLPNTFIFALIVGPLGYVLSFVMAWMLAQLTPKIRTVLAVIIYSPSLTAGVTMSVLWKIIFAGDETGYLNSFLLRLSLISEPIQWLQNPSYLLPIMIIVTLWGSMGIGFLAMLAGVLSINKELYEAGSIDGIRNRFQELFYITIPSMKPQMLFGAVMALVGTFSASGIGVVLSGSNPTPENAGQLIVNHIEDYGFIRSEMGYAAAISVILLIIIYLLNKGAYRLFGDNEK